ncbi:AAA family ATPase [candidate division KSB1 bacterium]|nr:AAA family ATPase [candidate division KSB1 bacterium]
MRTTDTPKIIAVAGGRGGVGKTAFATMLGICLAGFERRVILIDLDFSDANVHGYLNLNPEKSDNYFAGRSIHLAQVIQHTLFDKLDAITIQPDLAETPTKPWQKRRLFRQLGELAADYLILDLGSASYDFGLDLFMMADYGVLVSATDVFSIVNSYSFIRSALLRNLQRRFFDNRQVVRLLNECGLLVDSKLVKPLNSILTQMDPAAKEKFLDLPQVWNFRPKVVLNFAREGDEMDDFFLLGPMTKDLLNIELDYWGHIRHDENVSSALRCNRPDKLFMSTGMASEDVVRLVIRHLIAGETHLGDQKPRWPDRKNFRMFAEADLRRCSPRCAAWDACTTRAAGRECSKMNLDALKKAG